MSEVLPYIPPFRIAPREFTLHNSSPDPLDLRWGGLMFTIPAVNIVGSRAAKYDDGEPIPGTCILRDAAAPGKDGTVEARVWSAEEAIRNVLGIDIETGIASGMAAKSGISFLPDRPSREIVKQIREAGERRWNQSQIEWAEHETAARMAALELAKEHGTPPPTPSSDYRKAVNILESFHKKMNETFGGYPSADTIVESVTEEDEIEMEVYIKAAAIKMAEKAAAELEVDKNKVAEQMLEDPKIRRHLQKRFSIRKRGHVEEDAPREKLPEPPPPQTIDVADLPQSAGEPPGEG